jgi:hypothetical protein
MSVQGARKMNVPTCGEEAVLGLLYRFAGPITTWATICRLFFMEKDVYTSIVLVFDSPCWA